VTTAIPVDFSSFVHTVTPDARVVTTHRGHISETQWPSVDAAREYAVHIARALGGSVVEGDDE
jgi:hypothetical protein